MGAEWLGPWQPASSAPLDGSHIFVRFATTPEYYMLVHFKGVWVGVSNRKVMFIQGFAEWTPTIPGCEDQK